MICCLRKCAWVIEWKVNVLLILLLLYILVFKVSKSQLDVYNKKKYIHKLLQTFHSHRTLKIQHQSIESKNRRQVEDNNITFLWQSVNPTHTEEIFTKKKMFYTNDFENVTREWYKFHQETRLMISQNYYSTFILNLITAFHTLQKYNT